ncbi:MAG: histidine phosphatase family protein [Burkholderiales bacterium]|nr:histidine phosphatase family protein [Burkholderiales bacterium]
MIAKDAARRRIFLMRHGSVTYFDADGRPHPPDTVPLNAQGRDQADAAGRLFADANIRFDRVIVSGLARTVETAERVLAASGQSISLQHDNHLREIGGGKLSDIPDAELQQAFVGAMDGVVSLDTRFLGGETVGELMDRVMPRVDALRADAEWDIVLLVLHGGVNRAVLSYLLTGQRQFIGGLAQAPACVNAIDVGAGRHDVAVRLINHAPLDQLHTTTRKTTMEALYEQYVKFRKGKTHVL